MNFFTITISSKKMYHVPANLAFHKYATICVPSLLYPKECARDKDPSSHCKTWEIQVNILSEQTIYQIKKISIFFIHYKCLHSVLIIKIITLLLISIIS